MITAETVERVEQTLWAFDALHPDGAKLAELRPLFEGAGLDADTVEGLTQVAEGLGILDPDVEHDTRDWLTFSLGMLMAAMCFDHPVEELTDDDLARLVHG